MSGWMGGWWNERGTSHVTKGRRDAKVPLPVFEHKCLDVFFNII